MDKGYARARPGKNQRVQ